MATKRKPTPAQIAARERFAEMARSGAFKRKNNPMVISKQADESLSRKGSRGYVRQLLDRYSDDGHVVSVKKTRSGSIGIAFDGGRMLTVASARKKLEDHYGITERMGRRANPRASNPIILVSDKPIATKRKANPVKPKDMTVYQVQYRKPGMKLFEPWMTVMYPKMAEDIARRLADEPMAQTWTIKVESIKVKG